MLNTLLPEPLLYVEHSGSFEALQHNIKTAIQQGAHHLLVLCCNNLTFDFDTLHTYLQSLPIPVFGGLYPGLIVNEQILQHGSVVYSLPAVANIHYIEHLSDPSQDYIQALQPFTQTIESGDTLLLLVDGSSRCLTTLLDNLYELTGDTDCQYMGGGAGFIDFVQRPCLISNQGLIMDAALLVSLTCPIQIGIEHGWHKVAGPFVVTRSDENILYSLNYKPALTLLNETIAADCGKYYQSNDDFLSFFQNYSLGLARLQGEITLRDPLKVVDTALVCVGQIPSNHILYLMKAEKTDLLTASNRCLNTLFNQSTPRTCYLGLLFACVGRTLFLDEAAYEELRMIRQSLPTEAPLIGMLSMGEIADSGNICLEFLNKTLVLGILQQAESNT